MKKTKIIVPALGLLLLSTAASISGTVAWFTAQRTYTAYTDQFQVQKLDGALECTLAGGVGTKEGVVDSKPTILAKESDGTTVTSLADASYDMANGNLYTDNEDNTPESGIADPSLAGKAYKLVDSLTNATSDHSKWLATGHIYYAFTWTMTFTYTFGADTTNMNLFFNWNDSTVSVNTTTAGTGAQESSKSFRIAFINGSTKKVWAPLSDSKLYSSGDDAQSSFADGVFMGATGKTAPFASGSLTQSEQVARKDYLGVMTSGSPSVAITCVCWYEGNDPQIVNTAAVQNVAATMSFYTRATVADPEP